MLKKLILLALLSTYVLSTSGRDLMSNGGFENPKSDWGWSTPGRVERTEKEARTGKYSMRMHEDRQKSAAQLFGVPLSLNVNPTLPCKIRISFYYKGDGPMLHVGLYNQENGKSIPVKNELDKAVVSTFALKRSVDWTQSVHEITYPPKFLSGAPAVRLHLQRWGSGVPTETFLDDVAVEITNAPDQPEKKTDDAKLIIIPPPQTDNNMKPLPKLGYTFGIKDGYLTRNDKPFWYAGNYTIGGGQWQFATLWMMRLLNYSMTTLDWSTNYDVRKNKDGNYTIKYRDSESAISAIRELTRQNIIIEFDGGNYAYHYNNLRYTKGITGLADYYVPGSHFYSFDHNTPQGRQMHYNDWQTRFRFIKNMPLMGFECWNELGYTPSHERVLKGFRAYAQQKYGSMEEANKVWRRDFKNWNEVMPPHLSPDILPGTQAHQYRLEMRAKYFEQYYDWLHFLSLDFLPGFKKMKEHFRTFSNAPWSVDMRAHRTYSDGYGVMDIDLLDDIIDIIMLHTWFDSFDYRGQPADAPSVLRSITNALLFHNYFRNNSNKPIINPEDIVSMVGVPGSSQDAMKRNCLAQFPQEWIFTLENDGSGIGKGYYQPGFDDSKWGRMAVPGCWDETAAYKGRRGFGWYRAKFNVPAKYRADFADGSRKFYIYGQGVAQKGTVWINGVKVGEPSGWNTRYQYDIGSHLNYGGENQITFMVDGSNYSNGLRFYVYVLPDNQINETRPAGKKEYATRLWTYMMQGNSAVTLWNWDDIWRPFMPELINEINSVAEIAMPAAREKYAKEVGILMPYRYFRGLPVAIDRYFLDYMNIFGAITFRQLPVSVLGEKHIRKTTPSSHPVIFYPYARIVQPQTYAHMKQYVEAGGIAVVTFDSLLLDFKRYHATGIEEFAGIVVKGDYTGETIFTLDGKTYQLVKGDIAGKTGVMVEPVNARVLASFADGSPAVTEVNRGKGKLIFVAATPDFHGAYAIAGLALKDCNITPMIELTATGDSREFPWLEGKITGNSDRFMVYLHNWGGIDREVKFKIPERFNKKYQVRNIRTPKASAEKASGREYTMVVKSCEPAALLFESEGSPQLALPGVAPERTALLEKIGMWDKNPPNLNSPAPKALFLAPMKRDRRIGKTVYPQLVETLHQLGVETWEFPLAEISPDLLKKFTLIFIGEDHVGPIRPLADNKHQFYTTVMNYVREGGSLLSVGVSAQGSAINGNQRINLIFGGKLGFHRGPYAKNPASCGYDDAMQIKAVDFADHPVTHYLKAVQLFTLPTFKTTAKCELQPLVLTSVNDLAAPAQPVILGGVLGKGKVVFASDLTWLQPLRVEAEDNLQLLTNIAAWLTSSEIKLLSPTDKNKMLLVTESQVRAMEKQEGK